jgi:hypothetical protein
MTDESRSAPEPSPVLPQSTLDAVRAAILAHLAKPAEGTDTLHDALRRMAREANANQVRAEQLIVAFKQLWATMPELQNASDRQARSRLLERLITLCINEYYAD